MAKINAIIDLVIALAQFAETIVRILELLVMLF